MIEWIYSILKGFVDPVFILFVLLIAACLLCWRGVKKKTPALLVLFVIVLLYGTSIFPTANYLFYYLEKDYIKTSAVFDKTTDVIVVLGGGSKDIKALNDTFLTPITTARLFRAIELYHKNGAYLFICSGKGAGSISEAEVMAQKAQSLGVPKEKIKTESKSMNTWQNATEVNNIIANKKQSIGIVTSAYHMKRSEREFKKYFENVVALPADYFYSSSPDEFAAKFIPQSRSLNKTAIAMKEIVGRGWYSVKHSISG